MRTVGFAGATRRIAPDIRRFAMSTSGVLAAIDVVYTATCRIQAVCLLDALANARLVGGWLARPDDAPSQHDTRHSRLP